MICNFCLSMAARKIVVAGPDGEEGAVREGVLGVGHTVFTTVGGWGGGESHSTEARCLPLSESEGSEMLT